MNLVAEFVALYRQGKLPVDRLLTHRLKQEAINEGFERLREGKAIRQGVVFQGSASAGGDNRAPGSSRARRASA